MGLLLDTGVLIRAERSGKATLDFSPWSQFGDAAISVVTASELLVGVHRAIPEHRRFRRSATLEVARAHAELVAAMRQQGLTLGANDAYTAATALAGRRALLTTDAEDFRRVPGLIVLPLDQPPHGTMHLSATIKSIQDIMRRDNGGDGDAQRTGQLSWMLFLKIFDQSEDEWAFDARDQSRSHRSVLPEDCRWHNWAAYNDGKPQTPAGEIIAHVNNTVFPHRFRPRYSPLEDRSCRC